MIIHFDWETYSVPNINVGSWAYAAHPDADIVSCAWAAGPSPPSLWSPMIHSLDAPEIKDLHHNIKCGAIIAAWNATFEYDIWNLVAHKKYGWPKLKKSQLLDVQAIALTLALPADLATAAMILQVPDKDKRGKQLIHKLCKPRKPTKNNPQVRWPYDLAKNDYDEFFEYNRQDIVVERAIFEKIKKFMYSQVEHELWLLTLSMNEKGIPVDLKTTDAILDVLVRYEARLTKELRELAGDRIKSHNQVAVLKEILKERGLDLPDMNKATVQANLEDQWSVDADAYRILELRQLLGRSSVAKFIKLKEMADAHDRVHNSMRYHNCTTGRWGSAGMQVHNLPRGDIEEPNVVISAIRTRDLDKIIDAYPEVKAVCTSLVRPIIHAEPLHRLLIADYEAIEAITISWVVDHDAALGIVKSGRDIYKWFATLLFAGTRYENVTKEQRALSKVCLLGLGYQMGAPTFVKSCEGYGLECSWEQGEASVKLYRRVFKSVERMWYGLEKNALNTVRTGQPHVYGKFVFSLEGDFLRMRLPSGRKISYPYPKIEIVTTPWGQKKKGITCWRKDQKKNKWMRLPVSPGRLTENAIQAIARDIMADAKLRLAARGYEVLFSVHDEIICHNRVDFGDLEEMIEIMCDTDTNIYPGLPIRASGFVTDRYRKG